MVILLAGGVVVLAVQRTRSPARTSAAPRISCAFPGTPGPDLTTRRAQPTVPLTPAPFPRNQLPEPLACGSLLGPSLSCLQLKQQHLLHPGGFPGPQPRPRTRPPPATLPLPLPL